MTTKQTVTLVLGILGIVLGLIFLVTPFSTGGDDCGSLISPRDQSYRSFQFSERLRASFAEQRCSDARTERLFMTLVPGIGGIVAVVVAVRREDSPSPPPQDGPTETLTGPDA